MTFTDHDLYVMHFFSFSLMEGVSELPRHPWLPLTRRRLKSFAGPVHSILRLLRRVTLYRGIGSYER